MSDAIELRADHVIDLSGDAESGMINVATQYTGPDPFGVGLSVVTGVCKGTGTPRNEDLRKLHAERLGNKVFPLIVAIVCNGEAWLVGPGRDTAPVGPIEVSQAQRILQAGLDEPDGLSARQRVSGLLRSLEATDIPGFTNSGLFANHFLTTSAPHLEEWEEAKAAGSTVLGLRGDALLSGALPIAEIRDLLARLNTSPHIRVSREIRGSLRNLVRGKEADTLTEIYEILKDAGVQPPPPPPKYAPVALEDIRLVTWMAVTAGGTPPNPDHQMEADGS